MHPRLFVFYFMQIRTRITSNYAELFSFVIDTKLVFQKEQKKREAT